MSNKNRKKGFGGHMEDSALPIYANADSLSKIQDPVLHITLSQGTRSWISCHQRKHSCPQGGYSCFQNDSSFCHPKCPLIPARSVLSAWQFYLGNIPHILRFQVTQDRLSCPYCFPKLYLNFQHLSSVSWRSFKTYNSSWMRSTCCILSLVSLPSPGDKIFPLRWMSQFNRIGESHLSP